MAEKAQTHGGGNLAVNRVWTGGLDHIVLEKRDEGDYGKQLPKGGTTKLIIVTQRHLSTNSSWR